jgi:thiol-disulfide isomerase/thioredoxin
MLSARCYVGIIIKMKTTPIVIFLCCATLLICRPACGQVTNSFVANAEQMKSLRKEVDDAEAAFIKARQDRMPQDQADKLWKFCCQLNDTNYPKIFELARQEPASETACQMFGWIVANRITQGGPLNAIGAQSVGFLRDYHATNPNIAKICWELGTSYWNDFTFQPATDFLRMATDKNPNREVRGQAILALARRAKRESWASIYFSESAPPEDTRFAKAKTAYLERAMNENPESLSRGAEKLLNLVLAEYADCPTLLPTNSLPFMATLGEVAQVELYDLNHLSVGKMAPEISGEDIDGHKFKLSDYRGKVVMLSFWASWCGPCMRMVPSEVKLAERMKGKPFALIGVNGDSNRDHAKRAVEKEMITWPSFWSTEGRYGPIPIAWNVQSWPTIYLLDSNGVVRFKGEDFELLNQKIDQLLDQIALQAKPQM